MWADGLTDMTKLIVAFRSFADALKNILKQRVFIQINHKKNRVAAFKIVAYLF
jgi:hypothetical protein